jgi:hypothetical protein
MTMNEGVRPRQAYRFACNSAYDSGVFDSNEIRLNQLTYANGRTIGFSYGTRDGMNDYLNRIIDQRWET